MKKATRLLSLLMMVVMLFSLCSITALAEGFSSYEEYEADLNAYFESMQEEHEFVLRVNIRPNLATYVNYVTPDLVLNFKEVDTGKVTEIKLNKDNYISDLKCFELPIDFAESDKDTKFTVSMSTSDEFLTGFYDDSGNGGYCEANNGEMSVTITEDGLTLAVCNTRTDNFILYTVDENNAPMGNVTLRVFDSYTKEFIDVTSDENGRTVLDVNDIDGYLNIYSITEGYVIGTDDKEFACAVTPEKVYNTMYVTSIPLVKVETANTTVSTIVNVSTDDTFLFDVNDMELTFENENGTYGCSLTEGRNEIELPEGTYTVTANSKKVNISIADSITAGAEINATFSKKNTLKVYSSSGENYEYSFISIDALSDKVFSGTTEFGVIVDQSIMVKNLGTEEVYSVYVYEEGLTELDIATGYSTEPVKDTSSKYAPPTGDYIDWVILVFIIALIVGAVCVFLLYKNNKNIKKLKGNGTATKMLSLLLVGAMTLSLVSSPIEVFAGAGSVSGAGMPDANSTPAGIMQANGTVNDFATVVKISLVVNDDSLHIQENSSVEDLASMGKFHYFDNSSLYIAQDQATYDKWVNGGEIRTVSYPKEGLTHDVCFGRVWWDRGRVIDQYFGTVESRTLPIPCSAEGISWSKNEFMNTWLNLNDSNPAQEDYTSLVLNDYIRYLDETEGIIISDESLNMYRQALADGNLSIMFETMIGCHIKNDFSMYSFITTHDAVEVLHMGGVIPNFPWLEIGSNDIVRNAYNSATAGSENAYKKMCCGGAGHNNSKCATINHFPNTLGYVLCQTYLRTLKPAAESIDAYGYNPFGGWAFFNIGVTDVPEEKKAPATYGEVMYKIYDSSDNYIKTVSQELKSWKLSDRSNNMLQDLATESLADPSNSRTMDIPGYIEIDGVQYVADEGQEIPVDVQITDKDQNLVRDPQSYEEGIGESSENIALEEFDIGWTYPIGEIIADNPNTVAFLTVTGEEGTVLSANDLKYIFEVKVHPVPQPADGEGIVPQWRINKYWSSIMSLYPKGTAKSVAIFSLVDMIADKGHKKSTLSSDNGAIFELHVNDLTDTPFISNPLTSANIKNLKVKHDSPSKALALWGDLMAFKDYNIDGLTLANWVSSTPKKAVYEDFSLDVSDGDVKKKGDEYTSKDLNLEYSFSPLAPIIHKYGVRSHSNRRCHCYLLSETPNTSLTAAKYGATITFNCYNQRGQHYKSFTNTSNKDLDTGFADFTEQSSTSIRLFAEYPMLFTDVNHNDSIRFMTADDATEFAPISYHTLKYNAKVVPNISGVAATDSKATDTLVDMGMGDAQMLPRGSMTTSSYEVEGTLTAKTYALDFKSDKNTYKNLWNSTYSATKVNDEFLDKFSSWDVETNTYKATLNANENLKIDSQLYGNIPSDISISADMSDIDEYELTVRAGEITAINGYRDWETRYPEIADILIDKLKANHDGVFSVFNVGDGDELTEDKFAELAGAAREYSTSIAVGTGWYSEDTTVLSLYVYTTTFSLKGTTFANKIPTSISGLEAPQDKSLFYSKAVEGNLQLDLKLSNTDSEDRCGVALQYSTDSDRWADSEYKLYAVPNVSVQDTTN